MKLTNLMSELVKRNGSDLHLTGDSILLEYKGKYYLPTAKFILVKI